jgi:hypothetical protein
MTTNFSAAPGASGSAKIYQFPLRGRFAAGQSEAGSTVLPQGMKIASGSGWYHDAAIQDAVNAERGGKN